MEGIGRDGIGRDGMGRDGIGRDRIGWDDWIQVLCNVILNQSIGRCMCIEKRIVDERPLLLSQWVLFEG